MITDPILFRFIAGHTSKSENREIDHWLCAHPDHRERLEQLRQFHQFSGSGETDARTSTAWQALESRIAPAVQGSGTRNTHRLTVFLAAAAMLLILISSGLFWFIRYDARVIRNNELITKSFFLADGTQVSLGPASVLVSGRKFSQGKREVRLIGQAYFDVRPDPLHPFMVIAGEARVEVTGTRFAITAPRKTGEVEVSVKTGQVLFYNSQIISKKAFRMGLGPGDMGIYSPTLRRMDKTRDPYYLSIP